MIKLINILILVFIAMNINAGEVTGAGKQVNSILAKKNLNIAKLQQMGLKVTLGEVTGAGKIHVDDLRMIVTKNDVLNTSNLQHIEFKSPSTGKLTKEVKSFVFPSKKVKKHNILAYIVD